MAKVVGGFASSHSPLMMLPTGELWETHAQNDPRNRELVKMPEGKRVTYDELLASADPEIAKVINRETFDQRIEALQDGLNDLNKRFGETKPDVVVMFGDDQSEFFFDDNMPMINVYWGETIQLVPRTIREDMSESAKVSARAYGEDDRPYPVDRDLGLKIIEGLCEQDFDVSHSQFQRGERTAGPSARPRGTWTWSDPRSRGASACRTRSHSQSPAGSMAWTCRSFRSRSTRATRRTGSARSALTSSVRPSARSSTDWTATRQSRSPASGGLSHFVVDEELDRLALKGLEAADGGVLSYAAAAPPAVRHDRDPELGRDGWRDGQHEDGNHRLRARLPHGRRHRLRLRRRPLAALGDRQRETSRRVERAPRSRGAFLLLSR